MKLVERSSKSHSIKPVGLKVGGFFFLTLLSLFPLKYINEDVSSVSGSSCVIVSYKGFAV